jgi:predicted O-methyltransferase YrrM
MIAEGSSWAISLSWPQIDEALYSPFQLALKFIRFQFSASNGKGHGIHSPFVFAFVHYVLRDNKRDPAFTRIESMRKSLERDRTEIQVEDFGAGSHKGQRKWRRVQDIAATSAKPPKWGRLLFRTAHYYQPRTIIELGTSLGISAAYLAAGAPQARLYTMEGSAELAALAAHNLNQLSFQNARVIRGQFGQELPGLLDMQEPLDLAFVDGNHRLEPTLHYFELLMKHISPSAVIIFDDIHWSQEMEQCWATIQSDPRVMLSIDLFHFGMVFFRNEFKVKQDFLVRF